MGARDDRAVAKKKRKAGAADVELLATNLRWTWHLEVRAIFKRLFPEATPSELEWPLRLVQEMGSKQVEALLSADKELRGKVAAAIEDLELYLDEAPTTWYPDAHSGDLDLDVAYFAAEFALTDSLPIYAGGLGAVAGEVLKSASSLGVPLVGVGLLYQETSRQWLDFEGLQQEAWSSLDPRSLPLEPVLAADGSPVRVEVPFPGRAVLVQAWTVAVGRSRLYLLDTDLDENGDDDRRLLARLYGGGLETRFKQELVLGIGGARLLDALGRRPRVIHLNEGHAAFAILERMGVLIEEQGLNFDEARAAVAASTVFTTHTPVSAGHDYFPPQLAGPYLEPYATLLGVELEELLALGRYRPEDPEDTFCPTVFALRTADSANGVSRLHRTVTQEQWGGLWPRLPTAEVPIGHVTNGVHLLSWVSREVDELLDAELGRFWRTIPGAPELWMQLLGAKDALLWEARHRSLERLIDLIRDRARRGHAEGPPRGVPADSLLDPEALTIGFVGRFVAYKRPTLFLRDPDRLARLLSNPDRPVQIIFAGKAHPDDESGKALLREMIDFAANRGLSHRIVFLEDFDMTADKALSRGVDLWLNTPRRPLEACGIGGMKAGLNGALNLSTIDGWWDEAWNDADRAAPPIGWCIGSAALYEDHELQNELDAESLYTALERDIIPCFFERADDGLPSRWLASVRQSMATLMPTWRSHRMVEDYVESTWLPGARRSAALLADDGRGVKQLAADRARFEAAWPGLSLSCRVAAHAESELCIEVELDPAGLGAEELEVELWVAHQGEAGRPVPATFARAQEGHLIFEGSVSSPVDGELDLAARALPRIEGAPTRYLPGLIAWSR
jgi:starch phosphorylase